MRCRRCSRVYLCSYFAGTIQGRGGHIQSSQPQGEQGTERGEDDSTGGLSPGDMEVWPPSATWRVPNLPVLSVLTCQGRRRKCLFPPGTLASQIVAADRCIEEAQKLRVFY